MAAGSSSSWTSPSAARSNEFARLKQSALHLGLSESPFLPRNEREFEVHKREYEGMVREREVERLRGRLVDAEGRKGKFDGGGGEGRRVGVGGCMVREGREGKEVGGGEESGEFWMREVGWLGLCLLILW
jgi:hypothetical protein